MAWAKVDLIYTVRLKNGTTVEVPAQAYGFYKFFFNRMVPVLYVLFAPIRFVFKLCRMAKLFLSSRFGKCQ